MHAHISLVAGMVAGAVIVELIGQTVACLSSSISLSRLYTTGRAVCVGGRGRRGETEFLNCLF